MERRAGWRAAWRVSCGVAGVRFGRWAHRIDTAAVCTWLCYVCTRVVRMVVPIACTCSIGHAPPRNSPHQQGRDQAQSDGERDENGRAALVATERRDTRRQLGCIAAKQLRDCRHVRHDGRLEHNAREQPSQQQQQGDGASSRAGRNTREVYVESKEAYEKHPEQAHSRYGVFIMPEPTKTAFSWVDYQVRGRGAPGALDV